MAGLYVVVYDLLGRYDGPAGPLNHVWALIENTKIMNEIARSVNFMALKPVDCYEIQG